MVTTRNSQQQSAGGRSGVVINKLDESNADLDGWFDSAKSPEVESKQNGARSKKEHWADNDDLGTKMSKKKTAKTPKKHVNMVLRDAAKADESEEKSSSNSVKKYMSKLRRNRGTTFTSPSDLSRVSTAPSSPPTEETNHKPNDTDESETENALMTQDDNEEIALQSANSTSLKLAGSDVDDQAGEYGDDLGPPVLDQDSSNDENSAQEHGDKKISSGSANDDNILDGHDDDDDDEEGPGFNMVHDPETPLTVREERVKKEMEKIREERKKQNKNNGIESDNEKVDEDNEDGQSVPVKRTKKHKKKKSRNVIFSPKGIPIANRDYETLPIGALVEDSPDENGPRRSNRVRIKPLEFWRGEKLEFGAHNESGLIGKALGDMPVVTGIQKALPTPYRKRKQVSKDSGQNNKSSKRHASSDTRASVVEEEFNSKKLRRKYKFHEGEEAYLWDEFTEDTTDQKVVAYASNMEGSNLPISKKRKKSEGKVTGKAAQAFNISSDDNEDYVGYIMGNLLLPPKGIKDSESVGPCAQTFTVCGSQPKALEVAFGDPDQPDGELDPETAQRFLLGPGDMFRVPPGNSYRLENHSVATECLLTWTIIRPRSVARGPS